MLDALAARLVGSPATVTAVDRPTPGLARIVLEGPTGDWRPGDKIKLGVAGALRSYTPTRWDGRELELVAVLHGQGPVAAWAAGVAPGAAVQVIGPARSLRTPAEPVGLFLGDGTTLGLALAVGARHGAIALPEDDWPALAALDLPLEAVAPGGLLDWIAVQDTLPEPIVISGEADAVLACRDALRARGCTRFHIKPYWSTRGKRRRKELEAGALRA